MSATPHNEPSPSGRTMAGNARPIAGQLQSVRQSCEDIALCDVSDVLEIVRMSRTWLWAETAAGRFPAPHIRRPRMTRWRLADVRRWVQEQANPAPSNGGAQ